MHARGGSGTVSQQSSERASSLSKRDSDSKARERRPGGAGEGGSSRQIWRRVLIGVAVPSLARYKSIEYDMTARKEGEGGGGYGSTCSQQKLIQRGRGAVPSITAERGSRRHKTHQRNTTAPKRTDLPVVDAPIEEGRCCRKAIAESHKQKRN